MWQWRFNSLTVRLTGTLIATLAVLLLGAALVQVALQERYADESGRINGLAMSETLFGALHSSMLANDRQGLHHSVRTIAERSPNVRVRIFNKEGVIGFSTDPREVGQRVNAKSEACFSCHKADTPIEKLPPGERSRFFELEGVHTIGIIKPIENEPACSVAPCHAHSETKRLLGVLDVAVGMTQLQRAHQQTTMLMIATVLALLLSVAVAVVFVVRRAVHQPVRELAATLQAVGNGNYSARYKGHTISEFSYLGEYTNRMARDLERANCQLVDWAQTLEHRVEEKTTQLREAQDRMLHVERMASLGKLAAVVAHEINNPLASVVTYAKLLVRRFGKRGAASEEQEAESLRMLEAIATESKRCGEIVSNLLLFAQRSGPRVEPTNVNEIIDRSVFLLKHKMDLAEVQVDVNLDPGVQPIVADPSQVQQALLALFINGIEAMPKGGTLYIRSEGCEGGKVRVAVRDEGVGMTEEVKRRIFEPFFTTKGEGTGKGLGLGLAVVYGIVQRHQGAIDVESTPGQGSCFTMTLPASPPEQAEGAA